MALFYFICTYIFVIICVVLSHIFFALHLKNYDTQVKKHKAYWENIQKRCRKRHKYKLRKSVLRKLRKPQMLAAFYETYTNTSPEEFIQLVTENKDRMIQISRRFKSTTIRAYFAYVLSMAKMYEGTLADGFDELMIEYLLDNSVYSRENALKALYRFGKPRKVAKAFHVLSQKDIYHSRKLLTDGLMTFTGDFSQLSDALMEGFDALNECYKIAILNYLNYRNEHRFDDILMKYLDDSNASPDLKCNVLRIVSKIKSEANKQVLLNVLKGYNEEDGWEPAAVASSMMAMYKGDKDIAHALEMALTSRYWYVRMNSAKALVQVGISENDTQMIMKSEDAYAKNALTYAMRLRSNG